MWVTDRLKAWRGELVLGVLGVARPFMQLPFLRRIYWGMLAARIRKTGLFDEEHYLELYGDVANAGVSALYHYIAWGDREGRTPMVLFDPSYYRGHASGNTKFVNSLLHYAYVGRFRHVSPSPWFDTEYYLRTNRDVHHAGIEPLLHYLQWGGMEGRSPSEQFDAAFYLSRYPDVAAAGINPLIHYLNYGRIEGRLTLPSSDDECADADASAFTLPLPLLPEASSWISLRPRASEATATVDVVVPVYKGLVETLRCLHSILSAASETDFELIVINDASPDDDLVRKLEDLAGLGLFSLLNNDRNLGFVRTVNRGMSLHDDRDIVLVNSDAEVYDGWLDRMLKAARKDARVATVTPLSNNATICSYPRFLHDNPYPLEIDYSELNELAGTVNAEQYIEVPTGVGFCMFVSRACLKQIGLFDVEAFGKGYGEENDFCQRAIASGWKNLVTTDVFARHWGGASFQGEKAARVRAGLKVLAGRYPNYDKDVASFIACDPLQEARSRLDKARLQRLCKDRNILIVSHNRGGGTERHVQEDVQEFLKSGCGVFFIRPKRGDPCRVVVEHAHTRTLPNMPSFAWDDYDGLVELLRALRITEVHTHSLVDCVPAAPEHLGKLVSALGAKLEINLHDYKVICPRINLADSRGLYCGEPSDEECNHCLSTRGSSFGVTDIAAWRKMHAHVLSCADAILVPDLDVAHRLSAYFPRISFEVTPHEVIDAKPAHLDRQARGADHVWRIVVIGAISQLKGFDVLLACAQDAKQRRLPVQFIVMGYSQNDQQLINAGVQVTGRYHEDDAVNILHSLSPDIAWLPSIWPETYSYTLSIALMAGVPIASFDIGAIAGRLRRIGATELLMPLSIAHDARQLNDRFLGSVSSKNAVHCATA